MPVGRPPKKFTMPPRRSISTDILPDFGLAHGFDDDIGAAAAGQFPHSRNRVGGIFRSYDAVGAETRRTFECVRGGGRWR